MQLPEQTTSSDKITRERLLISSLTGIAIRDIAFDDDGWDSRAYVIGGGKIVFKFPRSEAIKKIYPNEIAALRLAAKLQTAIQIPLVKWTSPDNSYFGYEGIIGSNGLDIIKTLSDSDKRHLGTSIGEFLKIFHRQELPNAPNIAIKDEVDNLKEKYEAGRQILANLLSDQEVKKLEIFVTRTLPNQLYELGISPVLNHGDLGLWNIIYADKGHVGFIDFEDTGYYDESKDFIALEDPFLLDAALKAYGNDSHRLRLKIAARSKIMAFADIVFFAGKNNMSGIEITTTKIKSFI